MVVRAVLAVLAGQPGGLAVLDVLGDLRPRTGQAVADLRYGAEVHTAHLARSAGQGVVTPFLRVRVTVLGTLDHDFLRLAESVAQGLVDDRGRGAVLPAVVSVLAEPGGGLVVVRFKGGAA